MSEKKQLIILGTQLFAEEVADLVSDCAEFQFYGFAENLDIARCEQDLIGYPVIWIDELPEFANTHRVVCAIGTTKRVAYIQQVEAMGFEFDIVRHPTARVARSSRLGAGSILSAGVIVASYTQVGRHVIVNRGSLIGHHTRIGDFVTISPGANIAGRVSIGDQSYIGMGAVILDRITIGSQAVIGAGAVVTKDVPDNVQVMGVPARITKNGIDGR